MKIGIDCRTILHPGFGELAGVGHYTYFLIRHLLDLDQENEYVLFFDELFGKQNAAELVGNYPRAVARFFPFHIYRHLMPFVYRHLLLTGFMARERSDVLHAPDGSLPYTYRAPAVITIHDLAVFKHPEWFPSSVFERFSSQKILLPRAVKLARRIVVPSEATAADLRVLFPHVSEKISVIPHGVIPHTAVEFEGGMVSSEEEMIGPELLAKYHLGERYLLFVGTLEPRKNIAALIRAFRALRIDPLFKEVRLAIVGARGWKFEEIFRELEITNQGASPAEAPVQYLGYVPAGDKFLLMKQAAAFIFPSRYEGFGLPALEAMSMGTPVITSKVSSLPEVVGEAGILIDPDHEEEIQKAMEELLTNESLRQQLGEAGRRRAEQFTWMKTAERTLEIYRQAAKK
ncbi:glycosyltransferase family 4 protein [Candidatus Uhrbacteria bacterium]|nr:glycosyltransferase family 4 protein [Candidatus Uhrbacteria bacterium]